MMQEAKDCTGGHVVVAHCQNPVAGRLRAAIEKRLNVARVELMDCRSLTSFYAMDQGLIVSY